MSEEFLFQVKELVKNKISASINNTNIIEKSMRYSALSDSKMIRAGLIFASSKINKNLSQESVVSLAAAVELMHTYSLIHDDLPCMDDDSLRRGQPSNHIKFGEANAVLAGDALQALAYEIICDDDELSDSEKVYAMKILSQSCGKNGMVLGQQLDIENENNSEPINQKKLNHIHNLKTGKLIECSVMLGQIRSEINEHDKNVLKDFSKKIGLAFQITDDILEVSQSSRTSYAVCAFIIFRFFDIYKPFPISYFDRNFKNGFGIVLDDLIAGFFAIFPSWFLIQLIFV